MSVNNLFICGTPLQSLIVKRIIELEGLKKSDCALFFYTYVENDKHNYYYDQLVDFFSTSHYFFCDNRYPGYVIDSKKIFEQLDYDSIYFGVVNSPFVLISLSLGKHKQIYTFDDGTANISPRSTYATRYGLSLKKFLGLGVFGNRYTIQRIRNETLAHYTIYPDFKNNISDKLIPISIFPALESKRGTTKCSVILGTVFSEEVMLSKVEDTLSKLSNLCLAIEGDVYYIPHPRSMETTLTGSIVIESEKIAEEIIGELYQDHGSLDLYGFTSSAQLNVSYLKGLNNYFLSSSEFKFSAREMLELAARSGISLGTIIDLDGYSS